MRDPITQGIENFINDNVTEVFEGHTPNKLTPDVWLCIGISSLSRY